MRKSIWITGGVVAAAVGVTAIVAHAERGHDRGGWGHGGGYHNDDRGGRGWRRRWRREVTKDDFDAKTRSKFAKMDTNSDGVVDKAEAEARFAKRMERRRGRWGRRDGGGGRMMRRLRRYDTDGDGKITKAEIEKIVTERFQRMDLDSDGRITDADLPPMLRGRDFLSGGDGMHGHRFGKRRGRRHHGRRGHRGRGGKRMMRHLYGADTDKDGAVTPQELQDRATKRFVRFDRNQDGVLDQADREAFRTEMADYKLRRFFHRYGAGQDGKLTLEQFKKVRDERFARRDRDGDGVIGRGDRGGDHGYRGRGRGGRDGDRGGRGERRGERGEDGERGGERRNSQ